MTFVDTTEALTECPLCKATGKVRPLKRTLYLRGLTTT